MITKDSPICNKCTKEPRGRISPTTGKCIICEVAEHIQILRKRLQNADKHIVLPEIR